MRYHGGELLELTVIPTPSGVILDMVYAEDDFRETISIYCDDKKKKFSRLVTGFRNFTRNTNEWIEHGYGEDIVAEEAKLTTSPVIHILPPRDFDPSFEGRVQPHLYFQSLSYGMGETGVLTLNTHLEEIPLFLTRSAATEIGNRLHELRTSRAKAAKT